MNTWYRLLSLSIILSHDLSVSELQLIDPNFSGGSSGRDQGTLSIRNNLWRLLARQGQHRASCKQVTLDLKYLNLPLWYIVYIYPRGEFVNIFHLRHGVSAGNWTQKPAGQPKTQTHTQVDSPVQLLQQKKRWFVQGLGGFLFWQSWESEIWHAAKLMHFAHWFQNCFCFCSSTSPSDVCIFFLL